MRIFFLLCLSSMLLGQNSYSELPSNLVVNPTTRAQLPQNDFGGLTFFVDRATFDAAVPSATLEEFPSSVTAPNNVCSSFGVLSSSTPGICFGGADLLPGWSLTTLPDTNEDHVLLTTGFLGTPFNVVGPNTFTDNMRLDFNPNVTAVGFDLIGDLVGPLTATVDIYGAGGLIGSTNVVGSSTGTFWGVIANEQITRIDITSTTPDGGELIGNLAYGTAVQIPTLGTWTMLVFVIGLAFAAAFFMRRNRIA